MQDTSFCSRTGGFDIHNDDTFRKQGQQSRFDQ